MTGIRLQGINRKEATVKRRRGPVPGAAAAAAAIAAAAATAQLASSGDAPPTSTAVDAPSSPPPPPPKVDVKPTIATAEDTVAKDLVKVVVEEVAPPPPPPPSSGEVVPPSPSRESFVSIVVSNGDVDFDSVKSDRLVEDDVELVFHPHPEQLRFNQRKGSKRYNKPYTNKFHSSIHLNLYTIINNIIIYFIVLIIEYPIALLYISNEHLYIFKYIFTSRVLTSKCIFIQIYIINNTLI